jgi:4-diphosphocytidyl-2-C-methyl-D-erythritol kinase
VRIALTKRVPVAAGLGGGSSDAAAVLVGLNRLWERGLSNMELAGMGVKLGADVPFFCYDSSALVEGIGDRVTQIANLPKLFILLINPGFAVPTPWVYQEWDLRNAEIQHRTVERASRGAMRDQWLTVEKSGAKPPRLFEAFHDVTAHLANDLEPVTVAAYPQVSAIKKYLLDAGAEGALMSGSGPTVFGLFSSKEVRDRAAAGVTSKDWKVFATEN